MSNEEKRLRERLGMVDENEFDREDLDHEAARVISGQASDIETLRSTIAGLKSTIDKQTVAIHRATEDNEQEARVARSRHSGELRALNDQVLAERTGAAPHRLRVMQENERLTSAIVSVIGAAKFASVHGSRDDLIDALGGEHADVSDDCNALDDAQQRASNYQRLYAEERALLDSMLTEDELSGGGGRRLRAIEGLQLSV